MTAQSGGGQPDNEGRTPSSSVLERTGLAPDGAAPAADSRAQIFPTTSDSKRDALMRESWAAFNVEAVGAVKVAVDLDRTPPEIAYAVGEIVHNYFRARGATLTSYELRQLVSDLLDRYGVSKPDVLSPPPPEEPAVAQKAPEPEPKRDTSPEEVVAFEKNAPLAPWQGEETPPPGPTVPETVFEPPPSAIVEMLDREGASFDRLLASVIEAARPHVNTRVDRAAAKVLMATVVDKVLANEGEVLSPQLRQRLEGAAISELFGLGLIDRLWADRDVHAVYVNGPGSIHVERNGVVSRIDDRFRDEQHLNELLGRLAPRGERSVIEFQLRDGTTGVVVFPPAAPRGPVLALRRAEPGAATFERLIAADILSQPMADLLRIAARCRLNVLVSGPSASGKTALLAALARDVEDARVVTVAPHRAFRSVAPARIELVAQAETAPLPALLAAGASLRPELLVVDSVQLEDVPVLVERLSRGTRGTIAAIEPTSLAAGLGHAFDLVVRLGRSADGRHRVLAMQDAAGALLFVHEGGQFERRSAKPNFAAAVLAAGLGDSLAATLR